MRVQEQMPAFLMEMDPVLQVQGTDVELSTGLRDTDTVLQQLVHFLSVGDVDKFISCYIYICILKYYCISYIHDLPMPTNVKF